MKNEGDAIAPGELSPLLSSEPTLPPQNPA